MDPKGNTPYNRYASYRPCEKWYQCINQTNRRTKVKRKLNSTQKGNIAMEEQRKKKTNDDKGGPVVIIDTDNCDKEANQQWSDKAS